jgi:hypothetical protein
VLGWPRLARAASGGRVDAAGGGCRALGPFPFAPLAFALAWALAPLGAGGGVAGAAVVWGAPVGAGVGAWVGRRAAGVLARARTLRAYAAGVRPVAAAAVLGFAAAQAALVWAAGPGWVAVAAGAGLFAAGLLPPGPGAAGALGLAVALVARSACPSPLLTAACAVTAAVLAAYAVGVLSRASVCAAALDLSASDVPTWSKP